MSTRLKRFALVSLLGALALTVLFIGFFRYLSEDALFRHNTQHNQILASIFTNSLDHHGLMRLLQDGANPQEGRYPAYAHEFDATISEHIQGLPIAKVKVYNRQMQTVYSTERGEIGEDAHFNTSLKLALAGKTSGKLIYRDSFNSSDRVIVNANLFESYVPIYNSVGRVLGSFELYTDVNSALAELDRQSIRMIFGVVLLLGASYTVLFGLFYNTDRALKIEEANRERHLAMVQEVKDQLEVRVRERTRELENARTFLQSIIDGIADPVMVIGRDLRVTDMNQAARALVPEDNAEEFVHCYQISHRRSTPCEGEDHPCSFVQVLDKGDTVKLMHIHYNSENEPRYVEVVSTPLRDSDHQIVGVIEVSHDISEVVIARDHLKESEARIRAVMDTVEDSILTIDQQGIIRDSNRSAEKMFEYTREQLISMDAIRLFTPPGKAGPPAASVQGIIGPLVSHGVRESSVWSASGSELPVDLWVGTLSFQGSKRYIAVFHDIRERKQAERELEATRQQYFHQEKMAAIGQLAAGILHEVGNPIAAISGSLQAIQSVYHEVPCSGESCPVGKDVIMHLGLIEEQVNRLAGITREIADFASPRPGERELLDFNSLIKGTANLLRYDNRFRNVDVQLDLDGGLPAMEGVADQLIQVIMNLLINAVDACEMGEVKEPVIRIQTALEEGRIHLQVMDNGCGMDEVTLARAMDAFYTTKPAGKGTGLGLSLCSAIVSKHQGFITLESRLGQGTCIHLYLPVEPIESSVE
jgi:PAS domain S-box-containing protein